MPQRLEIVEGADGLVLNFAADAGLFQRLARAESAGVRPSIGQPLGTIQRLVRREVMSRISIPPGVSR